MIINRVVKQRLRQTRVVKKLFKTNIKTPSDRRRDHRRAFDADTDADVHPTMSSSSSSSSGPILSIPFLLFRFFRPRFSIYASGFAVGAIVQLVSRFCRVVQLSRRSLFLAFVSCLSGCHFKANFLKLFF